MATNIQTTHSNSTKNIILIFTVLTTICCIVTIISKAYEVLSR
jgi:Mg2+ and Co2+ transporter CorA